MFRLRFAALGAYTVIAGCASAPPGPAPTPAGAAVAAARMPSQTPTAEASELQATHTALVEASEKPGATADDWFRRCDAALRSDDLKDATFSMATIARRRHRKGGCRKESL